MITKDRIDEAKDIFAGQQVVHIVTKNAIRGKRGKAMFAIRKTVMKGAHEGLVSYQGRNGHPVPVRSGLSNDSRDKMRFYFETKEEADQRLFDIIRKQSGAMYSTYRIVPAEEAEALYQ